MSESTTNYQIDLTDPVTEAETRALAIANTFRDSIGEEVITGIIPGERGSGTDCILARTFNASCTVGYETKPEGAYDDDGEALDAEFGYACFFDKGQAHAFSAAVNKHRLEDEPESKVEELAGVGPNGRQWKATLPSAIAQIAVDFDHDALAEEFYEQHYKTLNDWYPINAVLAGEVPLAA